MYVLYGVVVDLALMVLLHVLLLLCLIYHLGDFVVHIQFVEHFCVVTLDVILTFYVSCCGVVVE